VWIEDEKREKINEIIIGRPDIAVVVAYYPAKRLDDTLVLCIREFRSAAVSVDGKVLELPGGSSGKEMGMDELAAEELEEETGLKVDPKRLVEAGSRQLLSTLATHRAHLYVLELSEQEVEQLRRLNGIFLGVETDSERTFPELHSLGEIRAEGLLDWSTLGMVMSVLV
jgi:8-oxo-dGTP pyrophosphatase MutT (NUDIX family)